MDVCDELEAPVPFSCRDASCGTCLVQVRFGAELLAPPDDVERRTLLRMGAAADQRLACRARLFGAAGLLTIRSVA
jgi:2Fe-2S ferredoxin